MLDSDWLVADLVNSIGEHKPECQWVQDRSRFDLLEKPGQKSKAKLGQKGSSGSIHPCPTRKMQRTLVSNKF